MSTNCDPESLQRLTAVVKEEGKDVYCNGDEMRPRVMLFDECLKLEHAVLAQGVPVLWKKSIK